MKNLSALIKNIAFTLTIPFIVKGMCFFVENLLRNRHFEDYHSILWIAKLNQLLSAAFHDYMAFIIMMLLVSLLLESIKTCYHYLIFQKKGKHLNPFQYTIDPSLSKNEATISEKIKQFIGDSLKVTICYTVFFGCFQFACTIGKPFLGDNAYLLVGSKPPLLNSKNLLQNFRSLDQIFSNEETIENSIISLAPNVGEILFTTSRFENFQRMVVSKDGKILFALGDDHLSILNISNPKRVTRKSRLFVNTSTATILLSPDEQTVTLFSEGRQSINVSNISSPTLMEKKEKLPGRKFAGGTAQVRQSPDGKFIYCSTEGYLDIFNATSLDLINQISEKTLGGKIALSRDGSKMVTENPPRLWNLTDPTKPTEVFRFYGIIDGVMEIAFSNDGTKVFFICNSTSQMHFQIVHINNIVHSATNLGPVDNLPQSFWFSQNQEFAFYFSTNRLRRLRLMNSEITTLFSFRSPDGSVNRAFAPSLNYQRNAVFIDGALFIIRFNIDIVPKSLPYFKPNVFKAADIIEQVKLPMLGLSKDEKRLFFAYGLENTQITSIQMMPYEKVSYFSLKRIYKTSELTANRWWSPSSTQDWKENMVIGGQNVVFVKRGTPEAAPYIIAANPKFDFELQTIYRFWINGKPTYGVQSLAMTADGKTIFYISSKGSNNGLLEMSFVPLQDDLPKTIQETLSFPLSENEYGSELSAMKINRNGTLIYCANRYLVIFQTRNPEVPVLVSSSALDGIKVSESILSKDENILYLVGTSNNQKKLQIFNVSDIKKPELISSLWMNQTSSTAIDTVELSPDEKLFYIGLSKGVLMVDVQNAVKPVLLGYYYSPNKMSSVTFMNNVSLVYGATSSGVTAFDLNERYILYMEDTDLKIGGLYQIPLQVLRRNENHFKFEFMLGNRKFLKVSLFEDGHSFSQRSLPIWMTFDKERSLLIVEPKSGSNNGTYKILVTSSTQTKTYMFQRRLNIILEADAENVMRNLIQSGYLDTEGYVTENFDPSGKLWIDPKYKDLEDDIRIILAQNYIQAIGEFSVSPSLELLKTNPLTIEALNQNHISVNIQLNRTQEGKDPYFLEKTYSNLKPTITNERASLLLEGSLEDVNKGLQEILIDLNGHNICNGTITVRDGINYPISENIANLSKYFVKNNESISVVNETHLVLSLFDSKNAIVDIYLSAPNNDTSRSPYFIRNSYKYIRYSLNDEQTLLHLEGALSDINLALQEILIDLNGFKSCQGIVNVTDGKNPVKTRFFENIETYFIKNSEPIIFSNDHPLSISSKSPTTANHLTVTLQFNESQSADCQARFVNKPSSFSRITINRKKSFMLELEGSIDDINKALREIVVDLGQLKDSEHSGGIVTLKDGVNPPISRYVENLSKHFHINQAPQYDDSLQAQIDTQLFYTGLYSMLELKKNTFTDVNNLSLSYDLETQTPGEESPSWISFRGSTLGLMGTPPEKLWPLTYKFKLVVKNEFKNVTVPFTLHVNISFSYVLKLAASWLGKIFTGIGLLFAWWKIYNFIFRKSYRSPRSYRLKLGEEINDSKIFPISFIAEEIKESKKIFCELEKYIKNQKWDSLFEYFVNPDTQEFDKEKIVSTLRELENKYYKEADSFSKGLIQQLIINKIVMNQLQSKQEKETLKIFNKIKNNWMDLVTVTSSSPPQFTIKLDKLEQELLRLTSYQKDNDETQNSLLLPENKENLDLLANAIIAEAFNFQNLDIETIQIDVISYKKLKGNSLWTMIKRFLQKDLKPFAFLNKQKIGYGIKYKIDGNTLRFAGRLTNDLKDGIIVVHFKKGGKKTLREIWLTQESQEIEDRDKSYMENISETL